MNTILKISKFFLALQAHSEQRPLYTAPSVVERMTQTNIVTLAPTLHRRTKDLDVYTLRGMLGRLLNQLFSCLEMRLRRRRVLAQFVCRNARPFLE